MKNIRYITYWFFHDDGYYQGDNGRYDKADSTDASKIEKTWRETLAYVNRCRKSSNKSPIKPDLVLGWECGRCFTVFNSRKRDDNI